MKIALLGYGKMGKTIEKIALNRGHKISLKANQTPTSEELNAVDAAIDFSVPHAAFQNLSACFKNQIPVACGTTGWLNQYQEAVELCKQHKAKFIYASNFSLGVNLFFELNETLAKMMRKFEAYQVGMKEIHHTQKLDAPSGTAISLAEQIIENSNYNNWKHPAKNLAKNELGIEAERIEDVKGTHTITYTSEIDSIEITHKAHSREGFALGAVLAAEWLANKKEPGVYQMKDVLNTLKS
ncbi:MAG: 4-hydroxy-tetrahydrodipicolinate reductase [Psychroflexus maritimus]